MMDNTTAIVAFVLLAVFFFLLLSAREGRLQRILLLQSDVLSYVHQSGALEQQLENEKDAISKLTDQEDVKASRIAAHDQLVMKCDLLFPGADYDKCFIDV